MAEIKIIIVNTALLDFIESILYAHFSDTKDGQNILVAILRCKLVRRHTRCYTCNKPKKALTTEQFPIPKLLYDEGPIHQWRYTMRTIEFVVMTINLGGAKQVRNQQLNLKEFASSIVQRMPPSVKPDIIAVQESHQVWHEKGLCLEKSEELSKILGNSYRSYFSPYLDSDHHTHHKKWKRPMYKGFSRVKQGNAIITNKDTAQWPWDFPPEGYPGYNKCGPLSTQISEAALFSTGDRNTEPRTLMVVPLSVGGISLYFMTTHLATLKGEDRHNNRTPQSVNASDVRLAQVHEILKIVDNLRKAECEKGTNQLPIIFAGDFNAQPDSPEINALEQTFVRLAPRWYKGSHSPVWTHAGHKIHIDHIFYNDPETIVIPTDCFVLPPDPLTEVLDHLPVVATFEIDQDL